MQIKYGKKYLKGVVLVLGMMALFLTGYTATSVVTSCPAEAQVCCNLTCILIATGTSPVIAATDALALAIGIPWAIASVSSYYLVSMVQFMTKIFLAIGTVTNNWVAWWETFWTYNMNPVLQDMAKQLSVLDASQARAIAGFKDAVAINRAIQARREEQRKSHMESRPSEAICVAGSMGGGMTRAHVLSGAYRTAVTRERLARSAGVLGTPGASGPLADLAVRYQNSMAAYCNPGDNGGAGCPPGMEVPLDEMQNADLDVPGRIFGHTTIDMKSAQTKILIDDMVMNLAEPMISELIPFDTMTGAEGQGNVLAQEEMKTKRQAVYGGLYHVIDRRVPGTGLDVLVQEIKDDAGVAANATGASPSLNETMEALSQWTSQNGMFSVNQIGEPENNARAAAVQAGIRTRQLNDIINLTDRLSIIVAAQVGNQLQRSGRGDVGLKLNHSKAGE